MAQPLRTRCYYINHLKLIYSNNRTGNLWYLDNLEVTAIRFRISRVDLLTLLTFIATVKIEKQRVPDYYQVVRKNN